MRTSDGVDVGDALAWVESTVGPVSGVRELAGGWTSTMLGMSTATGDMVLRLMTREPWRSHGESLTARESEVQRELLDTPVPAPQTIALDAAGEHGGFPAHLMTLVPGDVELGRADRASLEQLADVLAIIHSVDPTAEVRPYQSWAWEAKFVVPSWARDPGLWLAAFSCLGDPPPSHVPTFIHRDFQPRNVLWSGQSITGVVDWVETSMGPAWLDVAHCATNVALVHGLDAADSFSAAYAAHAGSTRQPYFDVMDIVGFLPPPGRSAFFADDGPESRRLEERLRAVMA